MQFRFAFKHMESSEPLSQYTEDKLRPRIERFSTKPIEAHVTFSVDHLVHHLHLSLRGGDGFNLEVNADSGDMYASVDLLVDKLDVQLKKQKERLKDHHLGGDIKHLKLAEFHDAEDPDDVPVDGADVVKLEKTRK